ncbi:hypothetical protein [Actinocatenispora rupis]|uniref:Lipoprotein n=1 Tax=Actinocatenispora rupis TaxID=519421 RepID=A0A8J3NE51_9ACTN|nr:hypothetical protein [Actinocatenispora rupis]GID13687.1 hypothetical protein Aru02nite_45760 [Actinocatenispora rupis]
MGALVRSGTGTPAALAAVTVLAAAALVGCGSSGVPPKTWAKRVCQAVKPWSATINDLTGRTQREMQDVTTPDAAKVSIVNLLDAEAKASDRARDKLLAAGVPDVDDGKKIAGEFSAALGSARDAYTTARNSISTLPTDDSSAFYRGVTTAIDKLNKQYDAGALDTDKVRSEQLQQAFDEVPECR